MKKGFRFFSVSQLSIAHLVAMPDPPKHIPEHFDRIMQKHDRIGHTLEVSHTKFNLQAARIKRFS
ncbi:hypothetical protein FXF46_12610 [Gluconobacter thailandicus]|uniref:Uncharacterized protein n=1 Tax=Gluconobacter thailandicus TaxID=257438 RepID=A0AAP9JI75_GLUTH|nr:hypothetical protein FXF46_12610 [Gluconobacter thailandicus]